MTQATDNSGGFATRAIHFGYNPAENQGALVPPIHTSATYAFPDVAYGARCFAGEEPGYFYTRIANPTLALLEGRLASLERRATEQVAKAARMLAVLDGDLTPQQAAEKAGENGVE